VVDGLPEGIIVRFGSSDDTMIDRRALLKILASLPLAAVHPGARAATTDGATAFARVSQALTGYQPSDADVKALYAAFNTAERRAALLRLAHVVTDTPNDRLDAALRDSGLDKLADDLVAAWYSGIVTNGKVPRVVLYTDAYVWSAMTFTKPMGVCGGVTGYWKDPP
jgi:D-sorbitol dehydrogenase-like protein